jgi:hypothetical protein
MLEAYFGTAATEEQKKRLLAVQAALEISKASVSASTTILASVVRWIYATSHKRSPL